jgi:hypothetical protein
MRTANRTTCFVSIMALIGMSAIAITGCSGAQDDETVQTVASAALVNHFTNITILIVNGNTSSPFIIDLGRALSDNEEANVRLTLRSQSGELRLIGYQETRGQITIPSVKAVQGDTIDVYLNERLHGSIDIYTTSSLPEVPAGLEDSVFSRNSTSMVVDMSKIDGSGSEAVFGFDTSADVAVNSESICQVRQALSGCGNGISGPGVGRFLSSSPGPFGQRYSYCTESAPPALNWPVQGDFAIDALYNQYWGCTQAIKVPNCCTYTVDASNNRSYCCGFPYYQPSIINPSTDPYFPDCPLTN